MRLQKILVGQDVRVREELGPHFPAGQVRVEERAHFGARPRRVMDAVGDVVDGAVAEHRPRDASVERRDAAGVVAEVHRQECHRESLFAGELLDVPRQHIAEDLSCEIVGEHVVPRGYRRVGREGAGLADGVVVEGAFFQEFERQEGAVTFVHVVRADVCNAERPEHPHSADAEDRLLLDAHRLVAAVEVTRDIAVLRAVHGQVRIEEVDRHSAFRACQFHHPSAHVDRAPFDMHDHVLAQRRQTFGRRVPRVFLVAHRAVAVQCLIVISVLPAHRDACDVRSQVRAGTHEVRREHAETAGKRRKAFREADFHREVRDVEGARHRMCVVLIIAFFAVPSHVCLSGRSRRLACF